MKSRTKFNVTPEVIKTMVNKHFPNEDICSIEELTEGMFNSAYAVRGTGIMKDGIVLKIGPASGTELLIYEQEILHTEVEVYKLLEDRPIKTPRILVWDYSHEEIPCDYFFMEYVKGVIWKNCVEAISPENRRQLMYELGKCNAVVHSVKGDWFGYIKEDKRFQFSTWGAAFFSMMSDILKDGEKRNCELPYDEIKDMVKKQEDCLNEVKTPYLVDFDMWAGNVFIDENSHSHITGIIDFERSFYGDPVADLTSAMMLFENVEQEFDFQQGYSEISETPFLITDDDRVRMNLYRLYMFVILFVESYRYDEQYAAMVKNHVIKGIYQLLEQLKKGNNE